MKTLPLAGLVAAIAVSSLLSGADSKQRLDRASLIRILLRTDISLDVTNRPVEEVIPYLRVVLGIPIVPYYDTDRIGLGIDPDTPISLSVHAVPAIEVLEMVLEQCDSEIGGTCTWQLRRGSVEVSTRARLNRRMVTRTYPLDDLLLIRPDFENAPDMDIDAALNQSGNAGGGSGGGFGGSGGGGMGSAGVELFGPPDKQDRADPIEHAEAIVDLIEVTIEPDVWLDGKARIVVHSETLVVTAPDYVHRAIAGYRP